MSSKKDGRIGNQPPREYQFKKGQSGNPRGRPPKIEREFSPGQFHRDILDVGHRPRTLETKSEHRTMSNIEIVVERTYELAMKGNSQMIKLVVDLHIAALNWNKERNPKTFRRLDTMHEEMEFQEAWRNDPNFIDHLNRLRRKTKPQ